MAGDDPNSETCSVVLTAPGGYEGLLRLRIKDTPEGVAARMRSNDGLFQAEQVNRDGDLSDIWINAANIAFVIHGTPSGKELHGREPH